MAICSPLKRSHELGVDREETDDVGVQYVHRCDEPALITIRIWFRTPTALQLKTTSRPSCRWRRRQGVRLQNYHVLIHLNAVTLTGNGMDGPYSQPLARTLVDRSLNVSDDESPTPVHEEAMTHVPRSHEEPSVTTALPWYMQPLVLVTMYSELSAARIPADFALVRQRLEQEWLFDGNFVS